jgi:hypothetical protein
MYCLGDSDRNAVTRREGKGQCREKKNRREIDVWVQWFECCSMKCNCKVKRTCGRQMLKESKGEVTARGIRYKL